MSKTNCRRSDELPTILLEGNSTTIPTPNRNCVNFLRRTSTAGCHPIVGDGDVETLQFVSPPHKTDIALNRRILYTTCSGYVGKTWFAKRSVVIDGKNSGIDMCEIPKREVGVPFSR